MNDRDVMQAGSTVSEAKRKLLQKYLRGDIGQTAAKPIPRRQEEGPAPLSYGQEQIWLHTQLALDLPLYNEPFTVHRAGPLDVKALERAFNEVIRRHEAWRTTFPTVDGQPVQAVSSAPPVTELPMTDLRKLPKHRREAEALRQAADDARRPFDLALGPLLRAQLVRLEDEEYRLFLTLHHLIVDGHSMYRVFLPELSALYEAFSTGKPSPLPDLPIQYADYAQWQRNSLKGQTLSNHMRYWRQQLAGDLPVLQLSADHPRPRIQTFRGATQPFALPKTLIQALQGLGQQAGATLFMTLVAAFKALLYRYSGQTDVLIGSVTGERKRPEVEKLLGFFLNTVVLRTNLAGNPTFRELLSRVREVVLGALTHNEVPFAHLVREVQPRRDFSRSPMFQVLITFEPQRASYESGWDLTPIDLETGATKFELCLVLDDRPEGVIGRVIYNRDFFDSATIARMLGHWQMLLEGIVTDPEQRIDELPLLTLAERHQLLVEWNDTRKAYPDSLVHELFQAQAKRIPEAVAVRWDQRELTYRALDCRANLLARHLQALGVRPESRVGLCVERSLEMIVGILGILEAGGAYVPMDPAYPQQRLAFMLKDSEVSVLVTQSKLRAKLPPCNARLVCLDAEWDPTAKECQVTPDSPASDENLAYVMYTSGSTGLPKGVLIAHRNLAQSTSARMGYYSEYVGNYLLLSSFTFDSSVAGIFFTLCQGGTLCLPPEGFHGDPEELAELISKNRVSQMLCFPSLYGLLLQHAQPQELAALRAVVVAGEPCPRELVERHYALLPMVPLFNEYGPTEATVWSTVYRCDPREHRVSVPIGRPISNTQCYVLDAHFNPMPVGVPGELYLGGDGLARGYLNQPELNHQKFIPNPFNTRQDERLYKTGDLVRYLPDGNLEFLGRVDNQVKVRGLRIELGEIEEALTRHPAVREAVVIAREDEPGNKRLVAYVASRQPSNPLSDELRGLLKSRLPQYMMPSAFVVMEALPRTPNGKADRRALSAPELANRGQEADLVAPRDHTEARLLKIWQVILGRPDIGVTQDFFALGGHSLLAARLLRRMEKEFDRKFTLANVFEAPSVEQMAALMRRPDWRQPSSHLVVPIHAVGSRPPLFCVRGGPRFRLLAQRLGPDQPVFGLHLDTSEARRLSFPYKLEEIASCLVKAAREVQPKGPYYLAGLCVNGAIAYEMARQLVAQGEQVGLLAMFDAQNATFYIDSWRHGRVHSLGQRTVYHLLNLWKLEWKAKGPYILDRLKEARRRINRIIWQIAYELQWRADESRMKDVEAIVHPAASAYHPQPYSGSAIMFQSTKWPEGAYFDFALSWRHLVAGGIEVHRVPGNHAAMFRDPNVDVVADKLRSQLYEAKQVKAEESTFATVGG